MATASAIASCVGLLLGNVLGIVLAALALRRMDASQKKLCGYRLVLTGWLVGLVGLFSYPTCVTQLRLTEHSSSQFPIVVWLALAALVVFPAFMLAYGWQDRLGPGRREFGYRLLGPKGRRIREDAFGFVVGVVVAVAILFRFGGRGFLIAGLPYLALSAVLFAGQRVARAVWIYGTVLLIVAAMVRQIWGRG
jgi:hypothetical protein